MSTVLAACERLFGRAKLTAMLRSYEVESLRRSHAMAPLSPQQVSELLETCADLSRRHEKIVAILEAVPASFGEVRSALNKLHQLTHDSTSTGPSG